MIKDSTERCISKKTSPRDLEKLVMDKQRNVRDLDFQAGITYKELVPVPVYDSGNWWRCLK